mgnify:CR=1 FL=1
MIKILKYGKYYATCNAVIEFEKEDIKTIQTGMNEYENIVKCPVCENEIRKAYWKKDIMF